MIIKGYPMAPHAKPTLYEQIGGQEGIRKGVDLFYKKVLLDGRVSHFFDKIDMLRLYTHQSQFLGYALGGPEEYKGRDIGEAHRGLVEKHGLEERHFDIVAEHLLSTFIDLGVPEQTRNEIMDIVASTKDTVLNR